MIWTKEKEIQETLQRVGIQSQEISQTLEFSFLFKTYGHFSVLHQCASRQASYSCGKASLQILKVAGSPLKSHILDAQYCSS